MRLRNHITCVLVAFFYLLSLGGCCSCAHNALTDGCVTATAEAHCSCCCGEGEDAGCCCSFAGDEILPALVWTETEKKAESATGSGILPDNGDPLTGHVLPEISRIYPWLSERGYLPPPDDLLKGRAPPASVA